MAVLPFSRSFPFIPPGLDPVPALLGGDGPGVGCPRGSARQFRAERRVRQAFLSAQNLEPAAQSEPFDLEAGVCLEWGRLQGRAQPLD